MTAPEPEPQGIVPDRPMAEALGLELPADDTAAVGVLLDALSTARNSADSYLDDLQRVAADFENYRKRAAREREETIARASERLVRALLPVLDSFDQAFAQQPQSAGEEQILAGVRGTYQQMMDILAREGLEMVPGLGEDFDPNVHDATAVSGAGEGRLVVVEELRRGYLLKGRLLRPAMVVVAPAENGG